MLLAVPGIGGKQKKNMKITKIVSKEVEEIENVFCNKCGESCKSKFDDQNFYGMIEQTVEGGYGSEVLEDLTTYTFSLCEKCLNELFKEFKISVEMGNYYV